MTGSAWQRQVARAISGAGPGDGERVHGRELLVRGRGCMMYAEERATVCQNGDFPWLGLATLNGA
jgi:hypothetical protein